MSAVPVGMDGSRVLHMSRMIFGQDQLQTLQIYKPKWCTWNMNILLKMGYAGLPDDIFSVRISFLQKQDEELFCLHARESFILLHTEPELKYEMI